MTRGGNLCARAYTLTGLLVSSAVMISMLGMTCLLGWGYVRQFSDPRSDAVLSREARGTADWLRSVISRALWKGEDFDLIVPVNVPEPMISIKWKSSRKVEEWRSERVFFRRAYTIYVDQYYYSANFQTLTPSLTLYLFLDEGRKEDSGWIVSISGHSFVQAYRKS